MPISVFLLGFVWLVGREEAKCLVGQKSQRETLEHEMSEPYLTHGF